MLKGEGTLRVATDFSGIETPLMALDSLGVRYTHMFASETCEDCIKVIGETTKPVRLYRDALVRDCADLPDALDVYVAGFPCQEFTRTRTLAGRDTGNSFERVKGPFDCCVAVIRKCRPKLYILENVEGIKNFMGGKVWEYIQNTLCGIEEYHVSFLHLNALDYGSLQNRPRVFFVGARRDCSTCPIEPPPRIPTKTRFEDILDPGPRKGPSPKRKILLEKCASCYDHPVFISNSLVSLKCWGQKSVPCILRNNLGTYFSGHGGILTSLREDLRLQGIPECFAFPPGVGIIRARRLIGNSMSVDVMRSLLSHALKQTGLIAESGAIRNSRS